MTEAHPPPPPIVALVSLGKRGNITSLTEFSGVSRNGKGHTYKLVLAKLGVRVILGFQVQQLNKLVVLI